eukprot:870267-Rhodomonas_salina.1
MHTCRPPQQHHQHSPTRAMDAAALLPKNSCESSLPHPRDAKARTGSTPVPGYPGTAHYRDVGMPSPQFNAGFPREPGVYSS